MNTFMLMERSREEEAEDKRKEGTIDEMGALGWALVADYIRMGDSSPL